MFCNFNPALAFVWRPNNDGQGFHNDPHDPGGDTNMGVTQATWTLAKILGYVEGELHSATRVDLAKILRLMFWDAVKGDRLASGVDLLTFDIAVVDGPGRAGRLLQRAVGADEDGIIGPQTLGKAGMIRSEDLLAKLAKADAFFLAGLPTFKYFGRGWERRLQDATAAATLLLPKRIGETSVGAAGGAEV